MTPDRHARVSEIFLVVAEQPPALRTELLITMCRGDDELRREVESLLALDEAPAAVDTPAISVCWDDVAPPRSGGTRELPARIGRYEIIAVLGEGGMGVVYRARQVNPARDVALKVLSGAAMSPGMLRRFEFEAAILGRLQHPGIAQIYEAGIAEDGPRRTAYFAMELVDGLPLSRYADDRGLSVADRVRLLVNICNAVHYAHQKGVIHRDLKPGNILINERGEVKILDFGVARTTSPDGAAAGANTLPGQIFGTLPYMSPEQLGGDATAIDTRSDVYALGIVAYELLAGRLPHELRDATLAQAVRTVGIVDPPRLGQFNRALRGDLETIVHKALTTDVNRRYQSAAELGQEFGRVLSGAPIDARRDSGLYVLSRAIRRHHVAVSFASALVLTMIAATIVSVSFAIAEGRQRRLADQRAAETREVAEHQARMLRNIDIEAIGHGIQAHYREQVIDALARRPIGTWPDQRPRTPDELQAAMTAFDAAIAPAQPADVARHVLDEFVLQQSASSLEIQFPDQPLIRAELHEAIGLTYHAIGLREQAARHLRVALDLHRAQSPPDHAQIAQCTLALGKVLQEQRRYAEAEALYREALAIYRVQLAPDDVRIARALGSLAAVLGSASKFDEGEVRHRESLELLRQHFGPRHAEVAEGLNNLAELLRMKGDYPASEQLHREALEIRRSIGGEDRHLATNLNNLANILTQLGRLDEALPLQQEALDLFRRCLGADHPNSVAAMHNLANTLRLRNDLTAAEPLFREALSAGRRLGDDPQAANSLNGLAFVLQARGELDSAESLFREAMADLLVRVGEHHPDFATTLNNLAALLHARRDYEAAEPLYRRALQLRRELLGSDHVDVAGTLNNLAAMLRDQERFAAAEPLYRDAIRILRLVNGAGLGTCIAGLGRSLLGKGEYCEAADCLREALVLMSQRLPPGHEQLLMNQTRLARALLMLDQFEEAESLLLAVHELLSTRSPRPDAAWKMVLESLADLYETWDARRPEAHSHAEKARLFRGQLSELRGEPR